MSKHTVTVYEKSSGGGIGSTVGKERSSEESFIDEPVWYQIRVLTEEMLDWANGRSEFRPSSYMSATGPEPKKHEYALFMIRSKAAMIDALQKLLD